MPASSNIGFNNLHTFAARKAAWFSQTSLVVDVGGRFLHVLIVGIRRGSWEASPAPAVTERSLGRLSRSPHLIHSRMPWEPCPVLSLVFLLVHTCGGTVVLKEYLILNRWLSRQILCFVGKNENTPKQRSTKRSLKLGGADITVLSGVI